MQPAPARADLVSSLELITTCVGGVVCIPRAQVAQPLVAQPLARVGLPVHLVSCVCEHSVCEFQYSANVA